MNVFLGMAECRFPVKSGDGSLLADMAVSISRSKAKGNLVDKQIATPCAP